MYLIVFFIGFFLMIVIHELGHLVCGYLSGYRFVSFRFLVWVWVKNDAGKIKLTKSPGLKGMAGQCLMEPPDDEKDFRFVLYNLGGGLANIITGALTLVGFFFTHTEPLRFILYLLTILYVLSGILNLLPLVSGGIPLDGRNIAEASKSPDARRGFYLMLKVNAEMSRGKHLADYDNTFFTVRESADVNNYFVTYMLQLRSAQLEELEDYQNSYKLLLQPDLKKLPRYYGGQLMLSLIFHELVYFGDEIFVQQAGNRLNEKKKDKVFQKLLTMKHPAFLPCQAAKAAFIDFDTDRARELITQARELNSSQQNHGQEHSVTCMLDKLEARLANIE